MLGGRRSIGKKEIEMDDGRILVCDIDEFGNIITSTCEEVIEKSSARSRDLSFPGSPDVPKVRRA